MATSEQAPLWGELQARLPGLNCPCSDDEPNCGNCLDVGVEAAHTTINGPCACQIPDLALLLRAAREAGWSYEIGFYGLPKDFHLSRQPYAVFWNVELACRVEDDAPLTAAMLALKQALDAEKEANHD